jgi:hypothetical protein
MDPAIQWAVGQVLWILLPQTMGQRLVALDPDTQWAVDPANQ